MTSSPTDYRVYYYYVGSGCYQLFIKNVSADADFVRIVTGYTEMAHNEQTMHITRQWIISPLQPTDDHVHIVTITKQSMSGKRMWIAFEAVKRGKKNTTVGAFIALSPTPSKWRTAIGSLTDFDVRAIESLKSIELAPEQHELAVGLQSRLTRWFLGHSNLMDVGNII